jgi:hypothetical protein
MVIPNSQLAPFLPMRAFSQLGVSVAELTGGLRVALLVPLFYPGLKPDISTRCDHKGHIGGGLLQWNRLRKALLH